MSLILSFTTCVAKSTAETFLNAPPKLPIGERRADTITTSVNLLPPFLYVSWLHLLSVYKYYSIV